MSGKARTAIDAAHLALETGPETERLRRQLYERVLDAELFVLLEAEADEGRMRPLVFEIEEGRVVLAFDLDERLGAFLDAPAPYAALAGRRLVAMLAGQGIGLGLNFEVAPSATLLPAAAVDWMAAMAGAVPVETSGRISEVMPPRGASPELLAALDPKLAAMAEVIGAAHLVTARREDGTEGLMLGLGGVAEGARPAVAAGVAEAVRFGGAGELDVTFFDPEAPIAARLAKVGLGFELPRSRHERTATPAVPGSDPDRPPILR